MKNVVTTVFVEFLWFSDEDFLKDFTLQHATGKQRIIEDFKVANFADACVLECTCVVLKLVFATLMGICVFGYIINCGLD